MYPSLSSRRMIVVEPVRQRRIQRSNRPPDVGRLRFAIEIAVTCLDYHAYRVVQLDGRIRMSEQIEIIVLVSGVDEKEVTADPSDVPSSSVAFVLALRHIATSPYSSSSKRVNCTAGVTILTFATHVSQITHDAPDSRMTGHALHRCPHSPVTTSLYRCRLRRPVIRELPIRLGRSSGLYEG